MISATKIDDYIWNVKKCLMKKYGTMAADRDISPLLWYINTGRAPITFLKTLIDTKPFMIARRLHAGGSDAEIIDRIKKYIGFND